MKKGILLTLLLSFLFSCSTVHIEKRRFRKGFHVSWNKNKQSNEEKGHEDAVFKNENTGNASATKTIQLQSVEKKSIKVKPEKVRLKSVKKTTNIKNRSNQFKRKPTSKTKIDSGEDRSTTSRNKEHRLKEDVSKKNKSALYYLFLLGLVPLIAFQKKSGFKLSRWASKNKTKAQVLVGVSTFLAVASSFGLGNILQWQTSSAMLVAPVSLVAASVFINAKKVGKDSRLFKNRFSYTLLNVGTTFGSFFAGTNLPALLSSPGYSEDPMILHPAVSVILILLLTILLVIALYGVAVLSCAIACNGAGVLAVIVLLGGVFLALFLASLGYVNTFRRESERGKSFAGKAAKTALIILLIAVLAMLVLGTL